MVLSFCYCICFILNLHENSCFKHLDTSSSFSISPQYIEPHFSSFYLLDTCVNLSKSSLTHPSITPDRSNSSCMHFIFIFLHVFHFLFPLCPQHLVFMFFLQVYGSLFSLFSLCQFSLYLRSFFFFFFGFLCPLTIVTKRGRNLSFECHSSWGVIDLGGELHVIGKKIFDVTNLGGELV